MNAPTAPEVFKNYKRNYKTDRTNDREREKNSYNHSRECASLDEARARSDDLRQQPQPEDKGHEGQGVAKNRWQ